MRLILPVVSLPCRTKYKEINWYGLDPFRRFLREKIMNLIKERKFSTDSEARMCHTTIMCVAKTAQVLFGPVTIHVTSTCFKNYI